MAAVAGVMLLYVYEEDRRIKRKIAELEERDQLMIAREKTPKMRELAKSNLEEMRRERAAAERAISAPVAVGVAFVVMAALSGLFTRAADAFRLPPLPDWSGYVFWGAVFVGALAAAADLGHQPLKVWQRWAWAAFLAFMLFGASLLTGTVVYMAGAALLFLIHFDPTPLQSLMPVTWWLPIVVFGMPVFVAIAMANDWAERIRRPSSTTASLDLKG